MGKCLCLIQDLGRGNVLPTHRNFQKENKVKPFAVQLAFSRRTQCSQNSARKQSDVNLIDSRLFPICLFAP